MSRISSHLLVCFIIFVAYIGNVYAKQPKIAWSTTETSSGIAHAREIFSSQVLPEHETQLLKSIDISVNNGFAVKKVLQVNYLPTFSEAHDEGTEYIYWDEATTDLILIEASVVLPTGESVRMNAENIRVRDSDRYNTFTNNREVVVPLSGVVSGSIIVLEYEKRTDLSKLESTYSEVFYPVAYQRDVSRFQLTFAHDNNLDINWVDESSNIDCNYAAKRLSCEGKNIEKLPYDENMLWRDELPSIVIARKANWQRVVRQVQSAFNKSDYNSKKVRDFALELTDGEESLEQKIHALHDYASRSIRYVSMSELGHRITPHKFDEVIENLFGDCKDKSALLVGMLRAIGIQAFPVLVATERRNPEKLEVPTSTYFDHMIVCFDWKRGRFCLDPTNTSTNWQTPASWVQGKVALELKDNSEPTTVRQDDYKWVLNTTSSMVFDKSAKVDEVQNRIYKGAYAGYMREGLFGIDLKERNEWLLKNYQNNVSGLTEPKFEIKHLEAQRETLEINSTAKYEPYYNSDEDLFMTEYDPWIRTELIDSKVNAKNYRVWLDGSQVSSEVVYEFGGLWSVDRVPATLEFSGEFVSLKRTAKVVGDSKLVVRTELKVKSHSIEPSNVEKHNKMIDVLINASNIHVEGTLLR